MKPTDSRPTATLRVGTVPYLIGRPLDCGLEDEPGIALVRHVPAELVAQLRAKRLDVALVSSIELFRRPGYRYLADLGVCAAGFVGSVQVFLRRPIEAVTTIALDPASRTAAALVQVLLSQSTTGRPTPRFVETLPGVDPKNADTDAWLAIGDPALRETLHPGALPSFNPSAVWFERTGLPFVFAVWIVREGVTLTPDHVAAFARARARGLSRLEDLAAQASREWQLPLAACRHYLMRECRYEPGPDLERALVRFRDEAARLGLCDKDRSPSAIAGATEHVA